MSGGSPQTTTTKSTATKTPYAPATQYFPSLYEKGANLAFNTPSQYVAGPTEQQITSNTMLAGLAPGAGSGAQSFIDMAKRIASGEFLDPSKNPAFAGAVEATVNPINRMFTERILPGLTNTAIQAGGVGTGPSAFGGASLGVPQMTAVNDWTTSVGDTISKMALDYSKLGASLIPQAAGLAREGEAQRLMPATIGSQAGMEERSWLQDAINNNLQGYSTGQNALTNLVNLLTAGNYGTTQQNSTQTVEQAQPSFATQLLQGLAGGAGIAASLFGAPTGGVSAASGLMNLFRGSQPSGPMLSGPGGWMPAPYY